MIENCFEIESTNDWRGLNVKYHYHTWGYLATSMVTRDRDKIVLSSLTKSIPLWKAASSDPDCSSKRAAENYKALKISFSKVFSEIQVHSLFLKFNISIVKFRDEIIYLNAA